MKTTKPAHTPGPWNVKDGQHITSDAREIGVVYDWSNPRSSDQYRDTNDALKAESDANARLIASAPDLLEIARLFREGCVRGEAVGEVFFSALLDKVDAVLTKNA